MKSFDWPNLLRGHPIFSSLTEEEGSQLLRDEVSQEKVYSPGSVIVREGEGGDSLFLVGSGAVQVVMRGPEGQDVPLAVLGAEEFFGEVAVLEGRPRSATVTALEQCLLLEIKGEEVRRLLQAHPDIHSQVHAKMSARVR
jgi:CRP-like cAMP-binding protein